MVYYQAIGYFAIDNQTGEENGTLGMKGGTLIRLIWILGLWLSLLLVSTNPGLAAALSPNRPPLTLELLQERLKAPLPTEGTRILDLRRLTIDLRSDNADFRDQFYARLQTQLQRSGLPLGVDLSYSQILGEFDFSKLGLRAPLYGQALSPIFSEAEQTQLARDRRKLSQLRQLSQSLLIAPNSGEQVGPPLQITVFRGPFKFVQTRFQGSVKASNTFFLNRVEAQGAEFAQEADWSETRFSQSANFTGVTFRQESRFRNSLFFTKADFSQGHFYGNANFQGSEFQGAARFSQVQFQQLANFGRSQWQDNADFSQTRWQNQLIFTQAKFLSPLFLTESIFEQAALFQDAQFNAPVNLREAQVLNRADFSYSSFSPAAYLNVAGLEFDADQAKILGDPGQIGRVFSAPTLAGNETLFRNLVQNFRQLQQIADANQIEYTTQQLRLRELAQKVWRININTASIARLQRLGFSSGQASQIIQSRQQQPIRSLTALFRQGTIDLATYTKVRNQVMVAPRMSGLQEILYRFNLIWQWLGLSLLLLLSAYGSSFWLIFGVGIVAIAYFGVLFWGLDRCRRRHPHPILPTPSETLWVMGSASLWTAIGLSAIFQVATHPWYTLGCLGILTLPLPLALLLRLYQQGRYHDLMEVSYLMEEGTLRQLRLLIGRLPIIPRYEMFRERYMPLLWDRRWNWLNYYDFSLNNLLRFGFNDIRLRDQHLPGLITSLVWYQWSLGLLYIALLLWTLSRTIPGLNLLIYLK